jgi:hypothetical protein
MNHLVSRSQYEYYCPVLVLRLVSLLYRKIIWQFLLYKATDMQFGKAVREPCNEYSLFNAVPCF